MSYFFKRKTETAPGTAPIMWHLLRWLTLRETCGSATTRASTSLNFISYVITYAYFMVI